jgi:hypothetical protein
VLKYRLSYNAPTTQKSSGEKKRRRFSACVEVFVWLPARSAAEKISLDGACERQKAERTSPFYSKRYRALILGIATGNATRKHFAIFSNEFAQKIHIFVIDEINLVCNDRIQLALARSIIPVISCSLLRLHLFRSSRIHLTAAVADRLPGAWQDPYHLLCIAKRLCRDIQRKILAARLCHSDASKKFVMFSG